MEGGVFDLYEIVPGVIMASAAIVAITLLGRAPPAVVVETFDDVRNRLLRG
jgi:sodium/proline symporter